MTLIFFSYGGKYELVVKTELERIGKRVSTFQGLLLLVLKMSHFMLRKMRHITAHVMSVGQEPVSHKYLLGPLGLGTAPQQCPPARTLRNGGGLLPGILWR